MLFLHSSYVDSLLTEDDPSIREKTLYDLFFVIYNGKLKNDSRFCSAISFYYTLFLNEKYITMTEQKGEYLRYVEKFFISISDVRYGKADCYHPYRFEIPEDQYLRMTEDKEVKSLMEQGWVTEVEKAYKYVFDVRGLILKLASKDEKGKTGSAQTNDEIDGKETNQKGKLDSRANIIWELAVRNMDLLLLLQEAPGHIYEEQKDILSEPRQSWRKDLRDVLKSLKRVADGLNRMKLYSDPIIYSHQEMIKPELEKLFLCNADNLSYSVENYTNTYRKWKRAIDKTNRKKDDGEDVGTKTLLTNGTDNKTYVDFVKWWNENDYPLEGKESEKKTKQLKGYISIEKEIREPKNAN